jgi:hypothetical protein
VYQPSWRVNDIVLFMQYHATPKTGQTNNRNSKNGRWGKWAALI